MYTYIGLVGKMTIILYDIAVPGLYYGLIYLKSCASKVPNTCVVLNEIFFTCCWLQSCLLNSDFYIVVIICARFIDSFHRKLCVVIELLSYNLLCLLVSKDH